MGSLFFKRAGVFLLYYLYYRGTVSVLIHNVCTWLTVSCVRNLPEFFLGSKIFSAFFRFFNINANQNSSHAFDFSAFLFV